MKPKIYNEFRVVYEKDDKGKLRITDKFLTKRGQVSIHDHEAQTNNSYVKNTKLFYELAEEPKTNELTEAKKKADELGIVYPKNISLDKLLQKIETYKTE